MKLTSTCITEQRHNLKQVDRETHTMFAWEFLLCLYIWQSTAFGSVLCRQAFEKIGAVEQQAELRSRGLGCRSFQRPSHLLPFLAIEWFHVAFLIRLRVCYLRSVAMWPSDFHMNPPLDHVEVLKHRGAWALWICGWAEYREERDVSFSFSGWCGNWAFWVPLVRCKNTNKHWLSSVVLWTLVCWTSAQMASWTNQGRGLNVVGGGWTALGLSTASSTSKRQIYPGRFTAFIVADSVAPFIWIMFPTYSLD